jgi:integrase/recombinase XerD
MKDADLHRFLAGLAINRRSRYTYITRLRAFRSFERERARPGRPLSLETIRAWIKHDAARSPLLNVVHRTSVLARYLEWRTPGAHPFAVLQQQCGCNMTKIVQALLQEDYRHALERLRPMPKWGSALGSAMREYVARMRSLGYRCDTRERELRRFDRFLQRRTDLEGELLPVLVEAWQDASAGLRRRLTAQRCGRVLSQTLRRGDETVPLLPIEIGLTRRVVQAERKPHVYTNAEIARLFAAARAFRSRRAPLRPMMSTAMLALAYCAGLRIGEIAALKLRDVDIKGGILEVRETEFFKSRRLPLARNVATLLARYLKARHKIGAPTDPEAPLWWTAIRRKGYSYSELEKLLTCVIRRAGLKTQRGRIGPRVHDLRHAFVAHRMLQWYRDGVEPQSRLPHLVTYLGHKDIVSTLKYLHITPELLHQASERYRRRGGQVLRAAGGAP